MNRLDPSKNTSEHHPLQMQKGPLSPNPCALPLSHMFGACMSKLHCVLVQCCHALAICNITCCLPSTFSSMSGFMCERENSTCVVCFACFMATCAMSLLSQSAFEREKAPLVSLLVHPPVERTKFDQIQPSLQQAPMLTEHNVPLVPLDCHVWTHCPLIGKFGFNMSD